jgi:hypothetical protein
MIKILGRRRLHLHEFPMALVRTAAMVDDSLVIDQLEASTPVH